MPAIIAALMAAPIAALINLLPLPLSLEMLAAVDVCDVNDVRNWFVIFGIRDLWPVMSCVG
jgi:hypothetical protein